ncbi:biotin--[acetyl-CoA-carboxylase] ligase [Geotoga petraea]|jgi:BirA family biotin operon repressor/biotin-[acetyl-CoA-carboxylase] ligase|uniref:Biotin--[acetyl-CoA-carboxylase] ligase n=1 Tax=Geotoga petraea TaxID=28234 RepID=A0A1G6K8X2_9BACT|nr:biotin--[acetyl-CoA-carboxylase] ligase [Geotoga petraea]MDK2946004.1 BirA family transcriptional regulator [Geotoga sp.]TGG88462.1 biotin--[acetyl-CoA-carboxylase] ligase [Geotoga petraea]SDC27318.1 BirA family transcriptional regulator, biotin operon repressor / biotin-[acetyl-CoA-carboxylase] ligase [Geotoga petraea]
MIGDRTIELYTVDSTNAYLKRNYKNFPSETVVVAKKQTEGYGRRGNYWYSDKGGLWYSVLFKPSKRPMNPWHYVRIFSLSIYDVLTKYNIKAKIKWPNDILVDDKKICGIASEGIIKSKKPEAIIVGVGMNVNNEIPYELRDIAVSLKELIGREAKLEKLLYEINHRAYNSYYIKYLKDKSVSIITKKWLERLNIKKGDIVSVKFNDSTETARVIEITPDYVLIKDKNNNEKKLYAGDISLQK